MNNLTIIKYELKLLIISRKYFYMILLLCLIALDFLHRVLGAGVFGTAPYSLWSFASLISMIAPFLIIILILMGTKIFSGKEKRVRFILWAAPLSRRKYYSCKALALFIACALAAGIMMTETFVYYSIVFKYTYDSSFIKPMLQFLLPAVLFFLGILLLAGKINGKLLYVLIPAAVMLEMNFSLPLWVDVYGNNFLYVYGVALGMEKRTEALRYVLPQDFLISRLVLAAVGLIAFAAVCCIKERE